jgi:predicted negative regulator of RcsB-dependent stress response
MKSKVSPMKSNVLSRLIVSAMVALPVAPVLLDYFGPSTYSRWLLADAANQFDQGNVKQAQESLDKAYSMSKDIVLDGNFWRQFERIENDRNATSSSTRIWEDMLGQVEDENQRVTAAMEISDLLSNRQRFEGAARILTQNLPPREERTPIQNNQLAYMRALAKVDLEEALLDINQALVKNDNESFLDTKAWVLHQLGRDEEALPIIEKSLSMLLGKWRANSLLEPLVTGMSDLEKGWETTTSDTLASDTPASDTPASDTANSETASEPSAESPVIEPPQHAPQIEFETVTVNPDEPIQGLFPHLNHGLGPVSTTKRGWAHRELVRKYPSVSRALPEITDLIATLRFHRMRILESLGRHEESKKDLKWLEAFSTKELDAMY